MRAVLFAILLLIIYKCSCADCGEKKCVEKCCPEGLVIITNLGCGNYSDLDLTAMDVYDGKLSRVGTLGQYFEVVPNTIKTVSHKGLVSLSAFYLLENGSIAVPYANELEVLNRDMYYYCVDYEVNITSHSHKTLLVLGELNIDNQTFLAYSLLISSLFLVLVLVVYALLPELRNLGGLVLMSYVGSMLLAYIFLFIIKTKPIKLNVAACIVLTLLICFFFLATFCWMNVMSYDVWWTFRGFAKARPIHRYGVHFKYLMYSLYSWGVPLVIVIIIGVMNSLDSKDLPPGVIKPEIPLQGCFIKGDVKLVYLYTPMLIMIVGNWIFFLLTAFNIWRLSRGSHILDSADNTASGTASTRQRNKERLFVYIKLATLMGLSWILEVVSSFTPKHIVWYISDTYNILTGLMIFIIFVCKKNIYRKLKKRYYQPTLDHQSSSSTNKSRITQESTEQLKLEEFKEQSTFKDVEHLKSDHLLDRTIR